MNNNLHIKTTIFCICIIAAICSVFWHKVFIILPIFVAFLIFSLCKKLFSKRFLISSTLLFIFTCLYAYAKSPSSDILSFYNGKTLILDGVAISLPDKNLQNKTRFVFQVNKIKDENNVEKNISAKTQVFLDKSIDMPIKRGDNLSIDALVLVPKSSLNPGEFDYGKYLANSDIYTLSFGKNVEIISKEPTLTDKILQTIDKIREKIIIEHSKYLNIHKTEILGGVVFGSVAIKPSPELKTTFINSGLYHLLAASGMNVAFIFAIWFFILIRFKTPYKVIIVSGGIVVFIYALMTGLPPSVVRATWMLELGLLGKFLDRKADNNVILFLVCAILLLYNPKLINDIGFLLSFMVTFGLLYSAEPIMEKIKFIPPKISGWVIIPFIAQVFAMPIQMYYFQTISVYSIIANMLVVPFMAVISFCGFVASIVAIIPKVGSWLCFLLDKINEPFLTFMIFVAENISNLPNNIIQVVKLNWVEILLYYAIIILLVYMIKNNFRSKKITIISILLFLSLVCCFIGRNYSNDLSFTFLNVGEGDSIFVVTPNRKTILIDTGRYNGYVRNSATSIILPFLKIQGINSIDLLVLSHPDTDHIAGSSDILKNVNVKRIITNGEKANNLAYTEFENYIRTNKIHEHIINEKEEISPDSDVSIIALKPPNINNKSQNDTSIILLFKYKNFDGILMGDNEINSYNILKSNINPAGNIELFKVGHHGSEKSVDEKMAKLLSPVVSVISVGKNSYGHPDFRVLSHLNESKIYRTDLDNAIKVKTDGKDFSVYTYNSKKSAWIKTAK